MNLLEVTPGLPGLQAPVLQQTAELEVGPGHGRGGGGEGQDGLQQGGVSDRLFGMTGAARGLEDWSSSRT